MRASSLIRMGKGNRFSFFLLSASDLLADVLRDVAVAHFAFAVLRPEIGELLAAKLVQDVEAAHREGRRARRGEIRLQRGDLPAHHQPKVARVTHPDFRLSAGIEDAYVLSPCIVVANAALDRDVFEIAGFGVPVVDRQLEVIDLVHVVLVGDLHHVA